MTLNPKWLAEGLCPVHRTTLERTPEYGWCHECGVGYSLTHEAINVHLRWRGRP